MSEKEHVCLKHTRQHLRTMFWLAVAQCLVLAAFTPVVCYYAKWYLASTWVLNFYLAVRAVRRYREARGRFQVYRRILGLMENLGRLDKTQFLLRSCLAEQLEAALEQANRDGAQFNLVVRSEEADR